MKTKRINGLQFEALLRNGLNNLRRSEDEINRLNVFPVPDGDTGTNMRLTLEHGLELSKSSPETGAFLKTLSDGMLLGARGNSGVILSQIFRGIFEELSRAGAVSAANLRNAFIRGYRTAYATVARPVEGTMLTVAREGVEHIRSQIGRSSFVEDFFSLYTAEMKKSLAHTPDMLPVLKEAGVVDSGGKGLILIIEGMLKALYGEKLPEEPVRKGDSEERPEKPAIYRARFDENSKMEDGYCVEFILQLMNGKDYRQDFNESRFTETLEVMGNSTVVVRSDRIVKVHVHVMKPSLVFRLAEKFGEFLTVKVENMQIQHNEHTERLEKEKEKIVKDLAVVAVANSRETEELYRSLGADIVLDGGNTMNTPAEDFVRAFRRIDAKKIVVLPNNKNIVPAVEQAARMTPEIPVAVLPSRNILEGYYALAADIQDSGDIEGRIGSMKRGLLKIETLEITESVRDFRSGDIECKAGEYIVLMNNEVVASANNPHDAVLAGMEAIRNAEEKETLILFAGEDSDAKKNEALLEALGDRFPYMETVLIPGGQPVYRYILGLI